MTDLGLNDNSDNVQQYGETEQTVGGYGVLYEGNITIIHQWFPSDCFYGNILWEKCHKSD